MAETELKAPEWQAVEAVEAIAERYGYRMIELSRAMSGSKYCVFASDKDQIVSVRVSDHSHGAHLQDVEVIWSAGRLDAGLAAVEEAFKTAKPI